jgi:hypothetical protein
LETPLSRDDLVTLFTERFNIDRQACVGSVDAMLHKMSKLELIHSKDAGTA